MMNSKDIIARRDNAVDTQMSTPIGREFVANLLAIMFWGEKVFSPSQLSLAHNVGAQSCANDLYSLVEDRQPEQTAMMLKEWRDRRDQLVGGNDD